jgi:hypothetical protein
MRHSSTHSKIATKLQQGQHTTYCEFSGAWEAQIFLEPIAGKPLGRSLLQQLDSSRRQSRGIAKMEFLADQEPASENAYHFVEVAVEVVDRYQ